MVNETALIYLIDLALGGEIKAEVSVDYDGKLGVVTIRSERPIRQILEELEDGILRTQ